MTEILATLVRGTVVREKMPEPLRLYRNDMVQRCTNPSKSSFKYYGGASPPVEVCERWRVLENFLADMGERPAGTTLGRCVDTGNYEPGNCKWMTVAEQKQEAQVKKAA